MPEGYKRDIRATMMEIRMYISVGRIVICKVYPIVQTVSQVTLLKFTIIKNTEPIIMCLTNALKDVISNDSLEMPLPLLD